MNWMIIAIVEMPFALLGLFAFTVLTAAFIDDQDIDSGKLKLSDHADREERINK